jgi:uncharacterized protein (DUF58 family)
LIVAQRDTAGLAVFDGELRQYIEPRGTEAVVRTMAEELERVEPKPRTDVVGMLHEFARRMGRRGFVILFSDLLDHIEEFSQGLDHLRFRGHNVIVFHILDPWELKFPFEGTRKFKGLEDLDEIITRPKRIRDAYMAELNAYLFAMKQACEKSQVDYVLVDTSKPVDLVLSSYLIERLRSLV